MKNIFFLYLIALSFHCNSQQDTGTYMITSNNPDVGLINANLDPFNVLISTSRMSFSSQLGLKFYKKGLYLNASGDFHYLDNLAEQLLEDIRGNSIYSSQKSRNISVNAGYYFSWLKNDKITFHLKTSSGGMNTTVYHVTKINVDYKKFFGPEIGIKSGYSNIAYNFEDKNDDNPLIVKNYYVDEDVSLNSNFTTFMQYTWLQVGFCFGQIVNAEANFSDIGIRKTKYMERYYAQFIIPISTSFEDIYWVRSNGPSSHLINRCIINGVETTPLGFRLGYEVIPLERKCGVGLEIGCMPGFKGMLNFYLSTKISFNLSKIIKN